MLSRVSRMKCENLDVWKRSCRLSVNIYNYFKELKDFGFKDQITRSSLSIASNIAEGMEKESDKEKIRFIEIAKGSAAELMTQIYIGIEITYIEKQIGLKWIEELDELLKMLTGLKNNYK
nr:four helix bundle protein [Hippea maritima]